MSSIDHMSNGLGCMPPPPERRCTATSQGTGEQCRQWSVGNGVTVCHYHGGGAPQVKRAAMERLLQAVDPAISELLRIAKSGDTDDVKLRAIRDVLDRAGLAAKQEQPPPPPSVVIDLRQIVIAALDPYPEAKLTVARKLLEIEQKTSSPSGNGIMDLSHVDIENFSSNGHAVNVVDIPPEESE